MHGHPYLVIDLAIGISIALRRYYLRQLEKSLTRGLDRLDSALDRLDARVSMFHAEVLALRGVADEELLPAPEDSGGG